MSDTAIPIPLDVVQDILSQHFSSSDVRIKSDAVEAAAEYLRVFAREAVWRSDQARKDREKSVRHFGSKSIEVGDLDKTAGQLVLDFS